MTRKKQIEILMLNHCTKKEAEKHLDDGTIVLDDFHEKKKKEEKPESMIALIGVLGGAFAGAYLWLIILGGIL